MWGSDQRSGLLLVTGHLVVEVRNDQLVHCMHDKVVTGIEVCTRSVGTVEDVAGSSMIFLQEVEANRNDRIRVHTTPVVFYIDGVTHTTIILAPAQFQAQVFVFTVKLYESIVDPTTNVELVVELLVTLALLVLLPLELDFVQDLLVAGSVGLDPEDQANGGKHDNPDDPCDR